METEDVKSVAEKVIHEMRGLNNYSLSFKGKNIWILRFEPFLLPCSLFSDMFTDEVENEDVVEPFITGDSDKPVIYIPRNKRFADEEAQIGILHKKLLEL